MIQDRYQSGLRVSEYVLDERVGVGAFAEVWKARHHIWQDELVAVKLPTEPEYVRYLQREGVVVHGLRHPNIVRVLGLDPYAEIPYLVMELVHGPSVRDVLGARKQGLSVPAACTIVRGTCEAMAVAHDAGVLHRDLKPGNILLSLNGRDPESITVADVKVSDFGLGLGNPDMLRSLAQSASIARDDQLVGTLAYMAPEVREGHADITAQADLYAIGIMLFELLTGERPAGAELPSTLRSDVPGKLDEVFRKLYARRDRRYESAAAVLGDLEAAMPRPSAPPPPVPTARTDRTCGQCGERNSGNNNFCIQCGQQLVSSVPRCNHCGGYPRVDDRFCIFCGKPLT